MRALRVASRRSYASGSRAAPASLTGDGCAGETGVRICRFPVMPFTKLLHTCFGVESEAAFFPVRCGVNRRLIDLQISGSFQPDDGRLGVIETVQLPPCRAILKIGGADVRCPARFTRNHPCLVVRQLISRAARNIYISLPPLGRSQRLPVPFGLSDPAIRAFTSSVDPTKGSPTYSSEAYRAHLPTDCTIEGVSRITTIDGLAEQAERVSAEN